ncbi:toll-like receptor 13 [Pomacea canaliculata]|nr:toll-like receptor 13 [Pomacea canaliculata]
MISLPLYFVKSCNMLSSLIPTLVVILHCGALHVKQDLDLEQTLFTLSRNVSVPTFDDSVFCFEDKCKCIDEEADCSQNYGALTFVPKLPEYIRFLNFTYNNLTTIDNADFFYNVTYIKSLDLGDNGLRYIHPQAFRPLITTLQQLFLDNNVHLDYQALQSVLFVKTLQRLDVIHASLGPLPTDLFYRFPLPRLQYMYWHNNHLRSLNFTVLKPLVSLESIGLSVNSISTIQSDFMCRLEKLVIVNNAIDEFPVTCSPNGTSYFPRLTNLFLKDNLIHTLTTPICLPKLTMLQLSGNRFDSLYTDMFNSQTFPSLVELYLKSMAERIHEIQKNAFNNTSLERISLLYNGIKFRDESVHADSFIGCPKIRNLALNDNDFSDVDDKRFLQLFGHLTKLVGLFMGNSFVQQVTLNTFSKFRNLQRLHLYGNELHTLPNGVFDKNNLEELILRANRLSEISPSTFDNNTIARLKSLDLSDNLFSCSCELRWFRDWMVTQPSVFAKSQGKYVCSDRQNVTVMSFYLPDQACLMTTDVYKFIIASVGVISFVLTLLSSLYRYRWHIRLVLYETFRDRSGERRRRLQDQVYNYDVFVSYAAEDLRWVQTRLMPEVEQRLGLRLCVHQRDFLAGKNIVDNIVDSINDSKKILMVFSTNFARSHWCQFELAFCLRHVMENEDNLIIVCLEDILSRDLTSVMMAVLKTNTYIQWQNQPDAAASFWGRLEIALQEILPRPA